MAVPIDFRKGYVRGSTTWGRKLYITDDDSQIGVLMSVTSGRAKTQKLIEMPFFQKNCLPGDHRDGRNSCPHGQDKQKIRGHPCCVCAPSGSDRGDGWKTDQSAHGASRDNSEPWRIPIAGGDGNIGKTPLPVTTSPGHTSPTNTRGTKIKIAQRRALQRDGAPSTFNHFPSPFFHLPIPVYS